MLELACYIAQPFSRSVSECADYQARGYVQLQRDVRQGGGHGQYKTAYPPYGNGDEPECEYVDKYRKSSVAASSENTYHPDRAYGIEKQICGGCV